MQLTVDDVAKVFGHRTVLDGVSFSVDARRVVGIVGPSGSGKTTLLSILGGILRPDRGNVLLDLGEGPTPPSSQSFAWVTQVPAVLRQRSVLDNAMLAALGSGVASGQALPRCQDLLHAVGLHDLEAMPARSLSGGEVQRLTIARAFAQDSAIVLADEPTGQLDHATTLTVVEAMCAAARAADRGLIVVTHDHAVAAACEEVVELRDGRVVHRREDR